MENTEQDTMENTEQQNVFFTNVHPKVFKSDSLYELLEPPIPIKPLTPRKVVLDKEKSLRKADEKTYVPRKCFKSKLQVKTVRNIRKDYEEYVNSYLPGDLEKQYKYLFKKIRHGSARDDHVLEVAKKLLKLNTPISRATWQMLTNLNVENNIYPKQYILFNSDNIQVNGSKGGSKKFISNYDVGVSKINMNQNLIRKNCKKKGMLNSSLVVNFKPGPLTKKAHLDESFQKFTLGKAALMLIPDAGLEISTGYGTSLEPSVLGYIQNCRDNNGILTEDWINFAVSSVGNLENDLPVQKSVNNLTFKLNFKNEQKRVLMRDNNCSKTMVQKPIKLEKAYSDSSERDSSGNEIHTANAGEISNILKDLVTAVEISINESNFTVDDEDSGFPKICTEANVKEKPQKKKCSELDKLDVTVIHVDGNPLDDSKACAEPYCNMGCVCQSLKYIDSEKCRLKSHCGRVDCMFECKCVYGKYSINDESFKDYIPGLLHLENKINSHLAKEEQKFHQTVFISENKKIVLTEKRRNCRMTKKYADYHIKLTGKTNENCKQLSILVPKISCSNIEPLCMVHGLYRCFCDGKFSTSVSCKNDISGKSSIGIMEENSINNIHSLISETIDADTIKSVDEQINMAKSYNENESISSHTDIDITNENDSTTDTIQEPGENEYSNVFRNRKCGRYSARTRPYKGRKHKNLFYRRKHKRIRLREQKDDKLSEFMSKRGITVQSISDDSDDAIEDEYDGKISQEFISWFLKEVENLKTSMSRALLRSPAIKKKSLVPWNILTKWYKEKIIFFLVNQTEPYNIYITQKPEHPVFKNCMNIEDIRVVDLPKCKSIIRHLLMNAELKDYYVILIGRSVGWEILGSVNRSATPTSKSSFPSPSSDNLTLSHTPELVNDTSSPIQVKNQFLSTDKDKSVHTEPKLKVLDNSELKKKTSSEVQSRTLVVDPNEGTSHASTLESLLKDKNADYKYSSCEENENVSSKVQVRKQVMQQDEVETVALEPKRKRKQTYTTSPEKVNNIKTLAPPNGSCSTETTDESSRWFVMTVEEDFTQIRFFKKGFFVNYGSIINAIKMARTKKKIVRLSAQTSHTERQGTTFGMYAVPSEDNYCVLIGPYGTSEYLNIECVTLPGNCSKEKTRGFWMYSKTMENENVLDDPLLYLSKGVTSSPVTLEAATKSELENPVINTSPLSRQRQLEHEEMKEKLKAITNRINRLKASQSLLKCSQDNNIQDNTEKEADKESHNKLPDARQIKVVKPIKISRKNGFYQLATPDWLKTVSLLKSPVKESSISNFRILPTSPPAIQMIDLTNITQCPQSRPLLDSMGIIDHFNVQIQNAETSNSLEHQQAHSSTAASSGFVILKPEQINNRLNKSVTEADNELLLPTITQVRGGVEDFSIPVSSDAAAMNHDIDLFLNVHKIVTNNTSQSSTDKEVLRSVAEGTLDELSTAESLTKPIRIVCSNISNIGFIPGFINQRNHISFEFPGFKKTGFYKKSEAFQTINQVLSRKVFVPKKLSISWRVESAASPTQKSMLSTESMSSDYILTRFGLQHKNFFPRNYGVTEASPRSSRSPSSDRVNTVAPSLRPDTEIVVVEIDD